VCVGGVRRGQQLALAPVRRAAAGPGAGPGQASRSSPPPSHGWHLSQPPPPPPRCAPNPPPPHPDPRHAQAADALRVTGIGRNEYIQIVNSCKGKKLLWRVNRAVAREYLPTAPQDVRMEPWWGVAVVNVGGWRCPLARGPGRERMRAAAWWPLPPLWRLPGRGAGPSRCSSRTAQRTSEAGLVGGSGSGPSAARELGQQPAAPLSP
jgi:hypothetical protein